MLPVNDELKREFYAVLCKKEGWSVRVLRERKNSILYERTAISKRPEETIRNDIRLLEQKDMMTVDMFYKDPCILGFLGLHDTYSEKDLENTILAELEKFILEMGTDFAFMARQKKVTIDGKDYKIDLLFFHRKLKRLVVVELKIGEFEPEYKVQVELYLRWLNKYERMENEEAPIALILCAEKSDEVIELLELDKGDIRVAQYLTAMPPKEELEEKLRLAIQKSKNTIRAAKRVKVATCSNFFKINLWRKTMSITVTTEKQFESDIEAFLISAEGGYTRETERIVRSWVYIRIN